MHLHLDFTDKLSKVSLSNMEKNQKTGEKQIFVFSF